MCKLDIECVVVFISGSSPLRLADDDDNSRSLDGLEGFDKAMFSIGESDDPSMNVMPRSVCQFIDYSKKHTHGKCESYSMKCDALLAIGSREICKKSLFD